MAADTARPIIVVKKKVNAAGHHGGAWKVAYADFVTAMMAFFMVMWLVASLNKEQRAAMFQYFHNPSMEQGHSVQAAPGQAGPGGASTSLIKLGGGRDARKSVVDPRQPARIVAERPTSAEAKEQERKEQERREKEQLESLLEELKKATALGQPLEPFKDQLLLDITPEGLRIQIVDKQNRPMFDTGSSTLKAYTTQILLEVAKYLNGVPNRISLSGHTDAKPYPGTTPFYSNWELSADRANAARRALIAGGLDEHKITRVVGLASSVLFVKDEPLNPINRRISIIVMTRRAEDAALSTDAPLSGTSAPSGPAPIDALPASDADAAAATAKAISAAPAAIPAGGPGADHQNPVDPAADGPTPGVTSPAPRT
jgi:chemotaxis protein MotB